MVHVLRKILDFILLAIAIAAEIAGVFFLLAMIVCFVAPDMFTQDLMIPLALSGCVIGTLLTFKFICL